MLKKDKVSNFVEVYIWNNISFEFEKILKEGYQREAE